MAHRAFLLAAVLLIAALVSAQRRVPADPNLSGNRPGELGTPIGSPLGDTNTNEPSKFNATITGSVLTIDNHPVPDARIDLRTLDGTKSLGSAFTNKRGMFELDNVPNGDYELIATADLRDARQRIELRGMEMNVTLRVANDDADNVGGRTSVSVSQMQVPEKARKAYGKAEDAFSKGKLDEARSGAMKALDIYPEYAEALTLKGLLDLQANKPNEARETLEKAVQQDGNYGMAHIALGAAYNGLHRYDDAVRVLDRGIHISPDSWQGYFERARALEGKQDWKGSLADLDRASRLINKDFPVIHLLKANNFIGLKAYPEAQAELQAFLDKESSGPNADEARRVLEQVKAATASAQR